MLFIIWFERGKCGVFRIGNFGGKMGYGKVFIKLLDLYLENFVSLR